MVKNNPRQKAAIGDSSKVMLDDQPDESAFASCTSAGSKGLPQVGASSHMTSNNNAMTNFREFKKPEKVGLGDDYTVDDRPESNMLKNLPKMLPGISQKFHLSCFSVFLLCLHYAPKLPTILSIVLENSK